VQGKTLENTLERAGILVNFGPNGTTREALEECLALLPPRAQLRYALERKYPAPIPEKSERIITIMEGKLTNLVKDLHSLDLREQASHKLLVHKLHPFYSFCISSKLGANSSAKNHRREPAQKIELTLKRLMWVKRLAARKKVLEEIRTWNADLRELIPDTKLPPGALYSGDVPQLVRKLQEDFDMKTCLRVRDAASKIYHMCPHRFQCTCPEHLATLSLEWPEWHIRTINRAEE